MAESINAVFAGLLCAACVYAVMSARVKDGLIVRLGLVVMALGFGAMSGRLATGMHTGEIDSFQRIMLFVHVGLSLCIIGVVWRVKTCKHAKDTASDWVDLDDKVGGTL